MKQNLKDVTFIIPVRIESEDRMRNVITVLCYLLSNFDTNIILKEVDNHSVFKQYCLPQITEYLDGDLSGFKHIFEQQDPDDPMFYRMRYLNEMIYQADTEIISNYDADVLLPLSSYIESQRLIMSGEHDVVYPYGKGLWQKKIYTTDETVSEFLSNDCDFSVLEKKFDPDNAESGHVQFIRKSVYVEAGMENENFISYSPEDKERIHRFCLMGYNVGRIDDTVYHLEHVRTPNSWLTNPHMQENFNLWNQLQLLNKEELIQYYKEQKYLKKYK